ncbi:MAG: YfhO family protein [Candidatus Levyibacteriota bacterium]
MKKEFIKIFCFYFFLLVVFFYKFFLHGFIPFPGDLLIGQTKPWSTYGYLGYTPGSYPNKGQYVDVIRQIYPWKTFSISLLKNWELPFWNPYNFSGSPLLANSQSAIFYPFNLLYFILPQILAWTILILLQPFLAGIFTYLFGQEIGLSKKSSFFSSIVFSFSLFLTTFLQYNTIGHVILFLPLLLYLTENIIKKITFGNTFLFVVSIASAFFAGHIQVFGFVTLFVFVYTIFKILQKNDFAEKLFLFLWFGSLFLLGFGSMAMQLLPTLELIAHAARVDQPYNFLLQVLLLQPLQSVLFISPDFFGNPATRNFLLKDSYPTNAIYIGLIPFILSFFAYGQYRKNSYIRFFTGTVIVLIVLLFNNPVSKIFYAIHIPFFSTGSPSNAIFLLSFSLAILSGFGLDAWESANKKSHNIIVGLFAFLFIIIFVSLRFFHIQANTKNFLYSCILFVIFILLFFFAKKFNKKKIVSFLFIVITIFDLFYFFTKFNPFVPSQFVFPNTKIFTSLQKLSGINRVWGYGNAAIDANYQTQFQLFSPDGYDPLYPKNYGEFIQAAVDGHIHTQFSNATRSDAVIPSQLSSDSITKNFYRQQILNMLGVKYIVDTIDNGSSNQTFPTKDFNLIQNEGNWRIFQNLHAAPRAFLTTDYKVYNSTQEFEKTFFAQSFDPSQTILLDKNVGKFSRATVKNLHIVSYTPNAIIFSTQSDVSTLLFLSDTYYPGWQATIDNISTKFFEADYAFRAIIVPKGQHIIVMRYVPSSFSYGVGITIISLVLLFLTCFSLGRVRRYYEK